MSFDEQTIILSGVCGSNAHGLATEHSDQDVHGVFVTATTDLFRLVKPGSPTSALTRTPPTTRWRK